MKELFNFIKDAKFNQSNWWIKSTKDTLRYRFSINREISETLVIKSVFIVNLLSQFILLASFTAILYYSIYFIAKCSSSLIDLFFMNGLMNFSLTESAHFLRLLSILLAIILFLFFGAQALKRFPNVIKFLEINRRTKRLITGR